MRGNYYTHKLGGLVGAWLSWMWGGLTYRAELVREILRRRA